MKTIGLITVSVVTCTYTAVMNGWALTKLWGWFVVNQFKLAPLTIPTAIGLALLARFLTFTFDHTKKDDREWTEKLLVGVILGTLWPLLSVAIGFIVSKFI